ncbi:hypothetical protein JIN85_14115 [Luteolibacter pohnpeiensis]|uniref:PA14 domain-containing protein n=1 Tax=Luteolibacter pohnpeiensis TaxID=454153 RepID=A0A934S5N1_9BACT|nr:LamG-like jellyroll fold domain-containing protein [Luteolibacter pohnpeiensis]MBK1883555.1 hypothetical protein [Luteolibacter pohnpeiensis]
MKHRYLRSRKRLASAFVISCGIVATHSAQADLVARWVGDDFVEGNNWVSQEGSVPAVEVGLPFAHTGGFNGHGSVDVIQDNYLRVEEANNPIAGATSLTLVAAFIPTTNGNSGTEFWQSSGLIGMEQSGVVPDWGMGWNGNRIAGGTGAPDRTIFGAAQPLDTSNPKLRIAVYTWNNSGEQRLYVNGMLVATDLAATTIARNSGAFGLGASTADGLNGLTGFIGELQIYNSDESANFQAITAELKNKYSDGLLFQSAGAISPTKGEIRFQSTSQFTADLAGTFALTLNGTAVPASSIQVSEDATSVVVSFDAAFVASALNEYSLSVPGVGGGTEVISGEFDSYKLPLSLPGPEGSVGSWGIREYVVAGTGNIQAAAVTATAAGGTFVDGNAPVFNHADPDSNDRFSNGNFNNDFNILTNTEANDDFVVVGKTQVTVPAAGVYTFSVHSDDGFAMRVSGSGGGRFISKGGDGVIDVADPQTLYRDGGTGDSNSRGTYQFDAAGTYDILYLGWDGGGGGFYEVAWTPGTYVNDRDTNTWALVGDTEDPSIPAYQARFATELPGPVGTTGKFNLRTYLQAKNADGSMVGSFAQASNFLATTTRSPEDADGLTVEALVPYLNHKDPEAGGGGPILFDLPIPGDTPADDNNVVTLAKGRIYIPTGGTYTFEYAGDDGFMLRLKGVNGNPNPKFKAASGSGNFQMSNLNELYFDGIGTITARGAIDLDAGAYDVEFIQHEGGGNFYYEIGAAPGVWLEDTTPPGGFKLVGYHPPSSVAVPEIKAPGWTVESGTGGDFPFTIQGAEDRIDATLAMTPVPTNAISTWSKLDFRDPEDGPDGNFTPTNPWPMNTPQPDDNYAMRATGTLVITEPGEYHLGFQGDDGGYLYIYGQNGTSDPVINSIAYTNLAPYAQLGSAPGSTVQNAIRVETGTGNSRTLVSVNLEVGEYRLQTLVYEGGGGSYWEVIGAQAVDPGYNYPLLETSGARTITVASSDFTLLGPDDPIDPPTETGDLLISGFAVNGNPATSVSFNFTSAADATYTIQASTDLETWMDLDTNLASAGTSTPVTVDLTSFTELNGQPKVFFRVVLNP